MSGGSAANTMCGVASFGGRAAYIGKVSDDELGAVFGHDLNAVGVAFRPGAPDAEHADRALHHRRHARRPAHDEHLPRRVEPAVGRRPRRGGDRRRRGALHGGLPVRPRRRQGGVPAGRRRRPRRRPQGVAHAVRLVLRRPPSRRLRRARARRGRHPVRQRRRAVLAVRGRRRSTTAIAAVRGECELAAITARQGRLGRRHRRRGRRACPPSRSPGCSTPPAPATSTPPGSSSATPAALPLAECGRLGSIAAAEVISHVGPRPLVELRTLLP